MRISDWSSDVCSSDLSSGIGIGALYGLVALGYFLFFQATTAINFAIGAIVMFSGMALAIVSQYMGSPWAIGMLVAVAVAVLLAWISEAAFLSSEERLVGNVFFITCSFRFSPFH